MSAAITGRAAALPVSFASKLKALFVLSAIAPPKAYAEPFSALFLQNIE